MNTKQLFTIGETAAINQISLKSLRHYDEIGLLTPGYIDKETKYRYYTYSQFAYIDKIKRYKKLGMPLKDIKDFFMTKDIEKVECFLLQQKLYLSQETERLEQLKHDIDYLSEFFQQSKDIQLDGRITRRHIDKRWVIFCNCDNDSDIFKMDMDLRQVIANDKLESFSVLNPYGYTLDFEALLNNTFKPLCSFVSTSKACGHSSRSIMEFPEGDYICFKASILSSDINLSALIDHLQKIGKLPQIIVACEYLKSFYDPLQSPYEIQILF